MPRYDSDPATLNEPKAPGDNAYPDYARIRTFDALGVLEKGKLYTVWGTAPSGNATDRRGNVGGWAAVGDSATTILTALVDDNFGDFTNGVVQPLRSVSADDIAAGDTKVQCFCQGSRILVPSTTGVNVGGLVRYNVTNNRVVKLSESADADELHQWIGRIFSIYTVDAIGKEKIVPAAGDYVVVELGMR